MKKFNFVYLALAFLGVIAMTSCEHPYADYTPGAKETNQGVYFPSAQNFVVSAEDSSVEILVARLNTAADAEVSVRVADVTANLEGDSLFTVDNAVKFVAEEAEAMLKVSFDGAALVPGVKYSLNIKLDPAEATNYAASEYVFTVTVPEPWVLYGATEEESVGIFFDDLLCYALQDPNALSGAGTYILYEKHAENPNRIRVVNPYGPNTVAGMWGGLPTWMTFTAPDPYYLEFDITDPEDVKIARNENFVEFTITEEDGSILGPFYGYLIGINMNNQYDLGFTWDPAAKFVLRDGIIKFPTEGIAFSAFNGRDYLGDFAAANQNGYMQYYLPGTPFVNLDMTAEYGGMKVEADNKSTSAIIKFGFAGDVESFKFTVVDGNISDIAAIVEGIVADSEEYAIYEGTIDTFEYTVPVEGTGMKTVVAVPYSGGEAKADYAISYAFYFPGLGGAELPDVEITVAVDSVVGITGNPDYEASYPSDSSMCIYMKANAEELTAIKGYVNTGVPAEVTPEEVFAQVSGEDFSDFIADMAENGYALAVYKGLTPGTTYDVFLAFTTIYGETKYFREQYTPGANSTPEQTGMRLNAKAPAMPAVLNLAPATLR